MKHGGLGLIVCALFGAGCVSLDAHPDAAKSAATPAESTVRAPVRAELVTAQNAHKQSQALMDELDREVQQGLTPGGKH